MLERDHNHPAIVGWCPLNETDQALHDRITVLDDVTRALFLATKLADPTRPVLDASGYAHRVPETDVYDAHSYEQDPAAFAAAAGRAGRRRAVRQPPHDGRQISLPYAGQPYFVSEFGGIWWNPDAADAAAGDDRRESWGYGERVRDEAEFHARFAGLVGVLLADPDMFGYCYTQLTDVMQERNGIYRFDRSEKVDVARVRAAQLRDRQGGRDHPPRLGRGPGRGRGLLWRPGTRTAPLVVGRAMTVENSVETETHGVELTDAAAIKARTLLEQEGRDDMHLRIAVQPGGCAGLRYQLFFDDRSLDGDLFRDFQGLRVGVDRMSAPYLQGAVIDFVDTIEKQGFTIDNPNAGGSCACGDSFN